MSKLFVTENDEVVIDLYVSENSSGNTIAWTKDEDRPENVEQVEKYSATFRQPNYKDTVELLDIATRTDVNGDFAVNLGSIRMHRIVMLIKTWDFVDENGATVEPTIDFVISLNPIVAMALADGLERGLNLFDDSDEDNLANAKDFLAKAAELSELEDKN